ncbi:MAG: hypothetical protein E7515_03545 [Ruminococcaceae bacterium]|nr:hypothetical protein [Oscillospiraceae bacterium]
MNSKDQIENSLKKDNKKEHTILWVLIVIFLMIVFSLIFANQNSRSKSYSSLRTWVRYKDKNVTLSDDTREQYVKDYVLEKYGLDSDVINIWSPDANSFHWGMWVARVRPKDVKDSRYFNVWVKNSGKCNDEYFLWERNDEIYNTVENRLLPLPFDYRFYCFSHYGGNDPPLRADKMLAVDSLEQVLGLNGVYTEIYLFINTSDKDKYDLKTLLRERLTGINNNINVFYCDDLDNIDYSEYDYKNRDEYY